MFNFIVDDIDGVLARIEEAGGEILRHGFVLDGVGTFAWFKIPKAIKWSYGNPRAIESSRPGWSVFWMRSCMVVLVPTNAGDRLGRKLAANLRKEI